MSQNQVFKYFEEISKIPRCSFHEEKIAEYLLNFAKEKGYEAIMDDYKNVTIIKEASKGYAVSYTHLTLPTNREV